MDESVKFLISFQPEQFCRMPFCLNSATHHIGLEVSTNTVSSSGTRWFDVDSNPSNPEAALAVKSIGILWDLFTLEACYTYSSST